MKERPILFSGEMVRAILDDRKTKTRRVVKFDESGRVRLGKRCWHIEDPNVILGCPYGHPGDRLWVRETFATDISGCPGEYRLSYRADHIEPLGDGPTRIKWEPAIHMFREYSRINLEVVSVRVERVQDITEEDAKSEGASHTHIDDLGQTWKTYTRGFQSLWDSINLKRGYGWDANPWVWVIEFKRLP